MRLKNLPAILVMIVVTCSVHAQNGTPYWSLSGNSNATPASKLGTINYTPLTLKTNNLSRLYVGADGKIGIGTTSPTSLFNVQGQTLLSIFTSTDPVSTISGSGIIGYAKGMPTATGQRLGYFLAGSQGGGSDPYNATGMVGYADDAWIPNSRPAYLTFETTKTGAKVRSEAMRITSDGRVGIGTKTPLYRLHVVDASYAIYAVGNGTGSYGVYAVGQGHGVYGQGNDYGVQGKGGSIGVYGQGSEYGVSGSSLTFGVYGVGDWAGVVGESSTYNGTGVLGNSTGGNGEGGRFYCDSSYGIIASTSSAKSYGGYFGGDVYTTGTYIGSDKSLKKNIMSLSDAVSIIKKLKPKTYEFLREGDMAEMNLPKGTHYGLIAQDLETVLPNLVKETRYPHRVDKAGAKIITPTSGAEKTFKAVNYTELIPILVSGMQEQDEKLESQNEEIQTLKTAVAELKAMLTNNSNGSLSSTSLDVASPNPAKSSTIIRYNIPAASGSAKLIIVNMTGQVLKEFSLNGVSGQVNVNVSNLASGNYPCTLWINGQPAVSKQLVVAR